MTISEYQKLAQRTCNDLGSLQENVTHMKLGIYTEVGELLDVIKKHLAYGRPMDTVNVGEEILDNFFYVANWATLEGRELRNSLGEIPVRDLINLQEVISCCEDILKQVMEHDEDVSQTYFGLFVLRLRMIANYFSLDFEKLCQNNIDKLKVRYPEKFDAHFAVNRNLDRERIELEK